MRVRLTYDVGVHSLDLFGARVIAMREQILLDVYFYPYSLTTLFDKIINFKFKSIVVMRSYAKFSPQQFDRTAICLPRLTCTSFGTPLAPFM